MNVTGRILAYVLHVLLEAATRHKRADQRIKKQVIADCHTKVLQKLVPVSTFLCVLHLAYMPSYFLRLSSTNKLNRGRLQKAATLLM